MKIPVYGGKIQAKHIPTEHIMRLVAHLENMPIAHYNGDATGRQWLRIDSHLTVSLSQISEAWPTIPVKVIQEKLRKLVEKGYLDSYTTGYYSLNMEKLTEISIRRQAEALGMR